MAATINPPRADAPSGRKPSLLAAIRRSDGWWLYAEPISPDVPLWGPWGTKGEAREVRRSWLRNGLGRFGGLENSRGGAKAREKR